MPPGQTSPIGRQRQLHGLPSRDLLLWIQLLRPGAITAATRRRHLLRRALGWELLWFISFLWTVLDLRLWCIVSNPLTSSEELAILAIGAMLGIEPAAPLVASVAPGECCFGFGFVCRCDGCWFGIDIPCLGCDGVTAAGPLGDVGGSVDFGNLGGDPGGFNDVSSGSSSDGSSSFASLLSLRADTPYFRTRRPSRRHHFPLRCAHRRTFPSRDPFAVPAAGTPASSNATTASSSEFPRSACIPTSRTLLRPPLRDSRSSVTNRCRFLMLRKSFSESLANVDAFGVFFAQRGS